MTLTLAQSTCVPALNTPTIQHLPNGLTIIAEQMPVEAVTLNLWFNVGSAIEPDPINGMAHFLEHMIFKGTPRLQEGEFERRVEERGSMTNAATSHDYTHFYINTAPQDFSDLAPLQIDVVTNPSIPTEAFERERAVVLEEIRRSDDNPRRRNFARSMEVAFERLPYRRPVLGPISVIEQLTPQQMRDFHATWYQPATTTAVAVGNLPVEQLIETVADGFTDARRVDHLDDNVDSPTSKTAIKFLPEPAFEDIQRLDYQDSTLQQARLIMVWRVPGLSRLEETYGLDILATILGQGRTARLIRDLREEQGLVSGISASNVTHAAQGVFYISALLPVENLEIVETKIAAAIHQIQTEWVTEAELSRIRTQVANRFIFSSETPGDRASLYGYYHALTGDLTSALDYPQRIRAIDAADLQRAAQTYLSPSAYGVVTIRPE